MLYIVLYYINIYIKLSNNNKGSLFVDNYPKHRKNGKKPCRKNVSSFVQQFPKMYIKKEF